MSTNINITLSPLQEKVLKQIEHELIGIGLKWTEWKHLFFPPYERVQYLEKSAPTFFSIVRESLMHEVIMGVMRLFDPASTFNKIGNENCSFHWLADNLTSCDTLDEFKTKMQEIVTKLVPVKEYRNKVLGHTDVTTHTVKDVPIPTIILDDLDMVIMRDLPALLNIISTHITNIPNQPYTMYTDVVLKGGAYDLMYFIKEGINTRTERIKALGLPRVNHGLGEVPAAKGLPSSR